jgi:hypothetical protein
MNKKGMDISLNFIILAVLALIALILVALFFTGGLTSLFEQTDEVGSTTTEQYLYYKAQCNYYCSIGDEDAYSNPGFPSDLSQLDNFEDKITDCTEMLGESFNSCDQA